MKNRPLVSEVVRKKALVYCRVSTKGQEEGTSLDSQARACIKHAESLGYGVLRVTKEVFSGAELWDRPQLARDRTEMKAGKVQALICYSTDRLSRNPIHLSIIAEECERYGVELVFVTEPMDNSPEGLLIRYVKGYAAQIEREKIKERMLRGRKSKLLAGKPTFHGWELYGYRNVRAEGRYEIYEPEASIVRRIFELYTSGYGTHSIAAMFNEEGIPAPKISIRPNVHWSSATIYRIITNPSYKGEEYQWKTKCNKKGRDIPRPESERVRMPDGIRPVIVSPHIWQMAQECLAVSQGTAKRNKIRPVLLRGVIYCNECGWRMIRNHYKRDKYDYDKYRCGSRWRPFKTACKGQGVPLEECNDWAWERVKVILRDPTIIERELNRLEENHPGGQFLDDLEAAKKQLARVERGLEALLRRFRQSADNEALWPYIEREIGQATKEKQQLEETISHLENRINKQMQVVADIRSLNEYCSRVSQRLEKFTFDEKILAFRALGVRIYANGNDPMKWLFKVSLPSQVTQEDDVNLFHVSQND